MRDGMLMRDDYDSEPLHLAYCFAWFATSLGLLQSLAC